MPNALFIAGAILLFVYGTVIGSFLNVCIYRLPRGESLVHPPSHCPTCNARLRPIDLAPLLSFLALRGKCRTCGTRISWRYFIIEFITGLLFLGIWWSLALRFNAQLITPAGLVMLIAAVTFASTMLVTFVIDLETTYVIESVTWVGMAAGVAFEIAMKTARGMPIETHLGSLTIPYLPMAVPGMVIGFLVFLVMDLFGRLLFRKPGMGLGDSFIGAAIGAMLGPWLALLSFGIAITLGALVGIVLIIIGALTPTPPPGSADSTSEGALRETDDELPQGRYMPFGPFLTASAMLIALAPEWCATAARQAFQWWFYQNPFL